PPSDLDLAADLDGLLRREAERPHRAEGVSRQHREELLAPQGHAGTTLGRDDGFLAEKIRDFVGVTDEGRYRETPESRRHVGLLHEAVADENPMEALVD